MDSPCSCWSPAVGSHAAHRRPIRAIALLHFVGMPADGEVECVGGCEGLAMQWTDRATLRLTPIVAPKAVALHYRAPGVGWPAQLRPMGTRVGHQVGAV